MRTYAIVVGFVIALAAGTAFAQADGPTVTLIGEDGSQEAFTLELYGGETPWIRYHEGEEGSLGTFRLDVDGESTAIDWTSVARIDVVQQGMEPAWVFTLTDGRELEGAVRGSDPFLELSGTGEGGQKRRITAHIGSPVTRPFTSILLPAAEGAPDSAQ
jgi:hypothetical protein